MNDCGFTFGTECEENGGKRGLSGRKSGAEWGQLVKCEIFSEI
jgi:hypothetical protein